MNRSVHLAVLVLAVVAPAHAEDDRPDEPVDPADAGQVERTGHGEHAGHAGLASHASHAGHAESGDAHAAPPVVGHDDHAGHDGHAGHGAHGPAGHHHAEHHALMSGHHHGAGASYAVSLGLIAATYDARLFSGDYLGIVPGARYARGRFGIAASLPAYRLQKNGKTVGGIGDLMLHGHASLVGSDTAMAGAMLMVMAPTGNDDQGLGMGHVMGTVEVWGAWVPGRFAVTGSLGYGRATGGGNAHVEHGGGMWPLVDPMNASEVTYGGTGMVALARTLAVGVRVHGALPVGDGDARMISGIRAVWGEGRVQTSADVQAGMIGDPFGVRGILETSVRFE